MCLSLMKGAVIMAYYRISEILDMLNSARKDGFEYVNVAVTESDEEFPESIELTFVDSEHTEDESIDSVELPKGY